MARKVSSPVSTSGPSVPGPQLPSAVTRAGASNPSVGQRLVKAAYEAAAIARGDGCPTREDGMKVPKGAYNAVTPSPSRSKFKAVPTWIDGIRFASRKEAGRYCELKVLEKSGEISRLELQPRYDITINGVKVCTYVADFRYFTKAKQVVEDCKGFKTPVYKLKRRMLAAFYNVEVLET